MSDQGLVMVYADPAKPDGLAWPPTMGIKALSDPGDRSLRCQSFSHDKILGIGELQQGGITRRQGHPAAVGLDHCGVIGRLIGACPGPIGGLEPSFASRLRCLGAPQTLTRHRPGAAVLKSSQGICHGESWQNDIGVSQPVQKHADMVFGHQGTGCIMNQDGDIIPDGQGGESARHRSRSCGSTDRKTPARQARKSGMSHIVGAIGNDHQNLQRPGPNQTFDRPAQDRPASEQSPLFGKSRPGSTTRTSGDDEGCKRHGHFLRAGRPISNLYGAAQYA
jgi:hypothetical protein